MQIKNMTKAIPKDWRIDLSADIEQRCRICGTSFVSADGRIRIEDANAQDIYHYFYHDNIIFSINPTGNDVCMDFRPSHRKVRISMTNKQMKPGICPNCS